jgi:uncharacterized protein
MRVNIDEIKEVGLQRDWDLTREFVDEIVREHNAGYRSRAPAHVAAHLSKVERRVLVKAHSQVSLTAPCGRCLSSVSLDVPVDFLLTYIPADAAVDPSVATGEQSASRHSHASFAPNAADEETYVGKSIDLAPAVREQILLALPGYPVCGEDCKGLCSVCGTNLNERDCGCDRHVPDPRWAALQKLKAKANE